MSQERIKQLVGIAQRAKRAYYYSGRPIMEDQQFDAILRELQGLDPNNKEVQAVGLSVPTDTMFQKITHKVASNSLKKVDTDGELRTWYNEMLAQGAKPGIIVELKADGATAIAYYEEQFLDKVVTRGGDDGIGEDITKNGAKFSGVQMKLPIGGTVGVRGEAIVLTKDAPKVDPDMTGNIRNIGNGIVRRGSDSSMAGYVTLVAFNYDIVGGELPDTEIEKIEQLKAWGFYPVAYKYCKDIDEAIEYWKWAAANRSSLPYKIDGIVFKLNDAEKSRELGFTSGRPVGERVLKFDAPGADTEVVDWVLTMGSNGVFKPTATLKTVVIDNTNVSSAQLNNWDIIAGLDIAIGDTVRVIKAKDIIPYIEEVKSRPATRKPIAMPEKCPWCGGDVGRHINTDGTEGADIECKNPACSEKVVQRIEQWIEKNRILGIGEKRLRQLVTTYNMKSPADLYKITEEQLGMVVGEGNAANIYPQIQKSRNITLENFLGSLSVPFLGRGRIEDTRKKVPGQMDTLADWRSGKVLQVADAASLGVMAPEIHKGIQELAPVIDDLLQFVTIGEKAEEPAPVAATDKLAGKCFVFTGKILRVDEAGQRFTRDMMHAKVLANGGTVDKKVKKSTTDKTYILVQADPNSTSSKTEDAQAKGVQIMSEADFWTLIGESPKFSM
jgi:DNA ligase (NAD+)